jgi:predicted nucleic acid-binding protein
VIAIVNSSPLIYLGKLGLLNLLQELFDQVLTVDAVREEVLDVAAPEYAILKEAFTDWLVISEVPNSPLKDRLDEMGLHQGEIDALILAYHTKRKTNSVMVIDDLAARDVAKTLGLQVTGTVGIILSATKRGIFSKDDAQIKIRFLVEETSFHMSAALYSRVISNLEKLNGN